MLFLSTPGSLSVDCFLCRNVLPRPGGAYVVFCHVPAIPPLWQLSDSFRGIFYSSVSLRTFYSSP